jgi:hypothetical protein
MSNRKNEFLDKLASLCDEYSDGFRYTRDDDGIHIDIDECGDGESVEVFSGWPWEHDAGYSLRRAKAPSLEGNGIVSYDDEWRSKLMEKAIASHSILVAMEQEAKESGKMKHDDSIRMPYHIAKMICDMAVKCSSDGHVKSNAKLMAWVKSEHPQLEGEFPDLPWAFYTLLKDV